MKYIEVDQEMADMVIELMSIVDKAEHPFVKKLLTNMIKGIQDEEVNWEENPFLVPLAVENPSVVYRGPEGVGDLHCVQIDGSSVSIWYMKSFFQRWMFLVEGTMALQLYGTPPPLSIRLDVENLVQIKDAG